MSDILRRFFDGDLWYSFKRHPLVIIAAIAATLGSIANISAT
jgi:hypothetical protein